MCQQRVSRAGDTCKRSPVLGLRACVSMSAMSARKRYFGIQISLTVIYFLKELISADMLTHALLLLQYIDYHWTGRGWHVSATRADKLPTHADA